jgi:4-hydroxyacetophenone monooxygenase
VEHLASAEHLNEAKVREAVGIANVPTLLMVLVELTGDRRWLDDPYRPSVARGLNDNDTGGLPDHIQLEIREAATEAILASAGRAVSASAPSEELLVEMLGVAMGEPVPAEYGPMIAAELGLAPNSLESVPDHVVTPPEGFTALVIGAGASGLCAGVYLQRIGVSYTIIEKNDTVGGTWLENRYPGAGVDTPNHLYSFSFAPYDWSHYFSLRDELRSYLEHLASEFDIRPHIRFGTEVTTATWIDDDQQWEVTVRDPDGSSHTLRANVVISAAGIFNPPVIPPIEGLDRFEGPSFHTARWPRDVDVDHKRVAIIGNGASSMQVGPAIADQVAKLVVFQRSPQWAAPFEQFHKPVPEPIRYLFDNVPLYRAWYRLRLGWTFNDRVYPSLQKDPSWSDPDRSLNPINDAHRKMFTRYIESELGDRQDLLPKVLPDYPPFGKRMLMDNGWFRMLTKDNVKLVTERIERVEADRIVVADGTEHIVDVVVIATGFDVIRFLSTYEAQGRSGRTLREVWEDDNARAYLGMAIPDFPNFFTLYGPNTQPGHGGSLLFVIERQLHYITNLLTQMFQQNIASVECRAEVHDDYNEHVDAAHENMVWTHEGMQTYYRNSRGRVVVNLPYRNVDLWHMTQNANLDDYRTQPRTTAELASR